MEPYIMIQLCAPKDIDCEYLEDALKKIKEHYKKLCVKYDFVHCFPTSEIIEVEKMDKGIMNAFNNAGIDFDATFAGNVISSLSKIKISTMDDYVTNLNLIRCTVSDDTHIMIVIDNNINDGLKKEMELFTDSEMRFY